MTLHAIGGLKPPGHAEPNEGLADALEALAAKARSGLLQSFIGTGFQADGMRVGFWGDHHENVYEMLGALAWLEHEYVHRHTG